MDVNVYRYDQLEMRSVECDICPIAALCRIKHCWLTFYNRFWFTITTHSNVLRFGQVITEVAMVSCRSSTRTSHISHTLVEL